jgi:hypothetical protein
MEGRKGEGGVRREGSEGDVIWSVEGRELWGRRKGEKGVGGGGSSGREGQGRVGGRERIWGGGGREDL